MLKINELLNKSYYDFINEIKNDNNRNIKIIIAKINANLKFVKYVYSNDYYYIYLDTKDEEICNQLKEILKLPHENDRRHTTNHYLSQMILQEDFMKKVHVSHIFQK
jgi:hypothetical protein